MLFWEELKRRNVVRVGAGYGVVAWVVLQGMDVLADLFIFPEWLPKFILFALLVGFPIAVALAWIFEVTPDGIKRDQDVKSKRRGLAPFRRRTDYLIFGALILALGYFVYDKFGSGDGISSVSAVPLRSIAVLPFVNMSDDSANEYFSDGISEELLNVLAQVPGLKVAGRTSSFAFKGRNEDLREIGNLLGVAHILEGSVRKQGDTVRITAQLIKVDDGFHLWSATYDRELTDVFAVQDEIAASIFRALPVALIGEDAEGPVTVARTDPAAYEFYLLARQRIEERTKGSLQTARGLLENAIAIDSEYAPALAALGETIILLVRSDETYGDLPRAQAVNLARPHIQKALRLDPDLADAQAAFGLLMYVIFQYEAAEKALNKAIELNSNLSRAYVWKALVAAGQLRPVAEIIALYEKAVEVDPLWPLPAQNLLGHLYEDESRRDEAVERLAQLRSFYPDDSGLTTLEANLMMSQGRVADAVNLLLAGLAKDPESTALKQSIADAYRSLLEFGKAGEYDALFAQVYPAFFDDDIDAATFPLFRLIASDPDNPELYAILAQVYMLGGEPAGARNVLEPFMASPQEFKNRFFPSANSDDNAFINLAMAYKLTGEPEKMAGPLDLYKTLVVASERDGLASPRFLYSKARLAATEGNNELALQLLHQALRGYNPGPLLLIDPVFGSLREMAAFVPVQATYYQKLNLERVKLGLEPIENSGEMQWR